MKEFEHFLESIAGWIWNYPLLILLMGGGVFFMIYSRFLPFRFFGHAINVIRGKYDNESDPGQINHFQALSGALAATIGMGNISGVAIAISVGGPGALFWMWVSAFFGIATKFFTCTLAVLYRGKDSSGEIQGGPMYFIMEGLGQKWKPLAVAFSIFGLLGATPLFQANQIVEAFSDIVLVSDSENESYRFYLELGLGFILMILTGAVIFGGIKRIGLVASRLVPSMVFLYILGVFYILFKHSDQLASSFAMIFTDAFSAKASMGGALGALIITGVRRAAFSNEAGIGTAPMMHGAAKTTQPVREGLVAMLGPAIDTLVICTLTGLAILVTGVWSESSLSGVSLTTEAFKSIPVIGPYILAICIFIFGFTTIFGLAYYGKKCFGFLFGADKAHYFDYWYVGLVILGSISTLKGVIAFVDMGYGLMAFPTMISAILLAPKVMEAARKYFDSI
ncbi:MAG: alanine/glycine:cation symporter family protein [Bacteroidota bacterium]